MCTEKLCWVKHVFDLYIYLCIQQVLNALYPLRHALMEEDVKPPQTEMVNASK